MPRGLTTLFILPGAVLFVLFFLTPLASVGGEAFDDGGSAFHRAMGDPLFWRALAGTLSIGITASLASVAVGLCVALHLSTLRERSRALVLLVISLPLTFSGLIVAYGFILLIGRSGFVTLSIAGLTGADPAIIGSFLFTPAGVALAYCYYLVPRAVLILLPAILNFDAAEVLAARSLGATPFRATAEILLPQIAPSIATALSMTAAVAMGAYGTALALVGTQFNILPLLLYSKISETGTDLPAAAAMSMVLMALCCLLIGIAEALNASLRRSR